MAALPPVDVVAVRDDLEKKLKAFLVVRWPC